MSEDLPVDNRRDQHKFLVFVRENGCPKCHQKSGGNWQQCEKSCPVPTSPNFDMTTFKSYYSKEL